MKIGIGIRTFELELLKEAKKLHEQGLIDYIEIVIRNNLSTEQINAINTLNIPLTAHGHYFSNKVNLADENLFDYNWQQIKQAYEIAKKISAKYFILHPGFNNTLSKCNPETILIFLKKLKEIETVPILIENNSYSGLNDYEMYFSKPEDFKQITALGIGICFDFRHAATVAANLNKSINIIFQEFSKLKPKYSHICGGPLADKKEVLTLLSECNEYDWRQISSLVSSTESQMLTIETPRKDKTSLAENIEDLKIVMKKLESSKKDL